MSRSVVRIAVVFPTEALDEHTDEDSWDLDVNFVDSLFSDRFRALEGTVLSAFRDS